MSIQFIDSVKTILEEVREKTGKDIEFIEKNNLPVHAALKMARKNMPTHLVFYKPEYDESINHLVAHECGHLFRMFATPEEKRLIPFTDQQLMTEALGEIKKDIEELDASIPFDDLSQIINLWYQGIVRQVTNLPPDIMIERWLYDDYPDLRPHQMKSIEKQLAESIKGLSEEVSKMTPAKILDDSNTMNYAFFRILGFHFGVNFIKAYSSTKYLKKGKALASITESEYVNSYEGDVQMSNRWAEFFGISNWFGWSNFEDVPSNYSNL